MRSRSLLFVPGNKANMLEKAEHVALVQLEEPAVSAPDEVPRIEGGAEEVLAAAGLPLRIGQVGVEVAEHPDLPFAELPDQRLPVGIARLVDLPVPPEQALQPRLLEPNLLEQGLVGAGLLTARCAAVPGGGEGTFVFDPALQERLSNGAVAVVVDAVRAQLVGRFARKAAADRDGADR